MEEAHGRPLQTIGWHHERGEEGAGSPSRDLRSLPVPAATDPTKSDGGCHPPSEEGKDFIRLFKKIENNLTLITEKEKKDLEKIFGKL